MAQTSEASGPSKGNYSVPNMYKDLRLTQDSYRSVRMKHHRARWCWLCWGNTPVLCMLGRGCCWKKVRHAVMLTDLSGLLGTSRVLVIGLQPLVAPGTALLPTRSLFTAHYYVLCIGQPAIGHLHCARPCDLF